MNVPGTKSLTSVRMSMDKIDDVITRMSSKSGIPHSKTPVKFLPEDYAMT